MTPTTIKIFRQAVERGLRLKAVGHALHVNPARCCPPDFLSVLRAHKSDLLVLLQLPFVMAYSKTLGETIFLCQDEETRAALIEAGAEPFSIYTHAELRGADTEAIRQRGHNELSTYDIGRDLKRDVWQAIGQRSR